MKKEGKEKTLAEKYGFKRGDDCGSLVRLFYRYMGGFVAKMLAKTSIIPIHISIFAFFLTFISAYFFYLGTYPFIIYGSVIYFIGMILDATDGSLARIKNMKTSFGGWFDASTDNTDLIILMFAITLGLYNQTQNWMVWVYSFLSYTAISSLSYSELIFNKHFSFADKIIRKTKIKHGWISTFYYNGLSFKTLIVLAGLFNMFYSFLVFTAIFGWFYFFLFFFLFSHKAHKFSKSKENK